MKRNAAGWPLAIVVLYGCMACGRGSEVEAPVGRRPVPTVAMDNRWSQSTEWIDRYDPDRASPGYNLVLYNRRVPLLIDMDGQVVHSWSEVRASGRARLLPDGHLAVLAESGQFELYDWQGTRVWSYSLVDPDTFLHHDFIQLENGHFLLLAHDPAVQSDFLLEVDQSGTIIWRWNAHEHLAGDFPRAGQRNNKTHINSVNELPDNRWYDRGLQALRPGNILISARNLNAIYVVSRDTGEVVWRYYDGLDYQHEALMIPPGRPGAGNILVFNNGYHNSYAFRQSAILEIDPQNRSKAWEYRRQGFYSSTGGTQQSLPNGNLLVTSSQGGRVFEVTRDGEIVWQWSPPYLPMRVSRYPREFSPQTIQLGEPAAEPIDARDPSQFIDANLYTFALPHESRRVSVAGRTRSILRNQDRCQILQLPPAPKVRFGYGGWRQDSSTPFIGSQARFVATMRVVDTDTSETLLDRTLGGDAILVGESDDKLGLVQETISIDRYGGLTAELCLNLTGAQGGPAPEEFVWEEPAISAATRAVLIEPETELDREALEQQEKHLKAIGYLN